MFDLIKVKTGDVAVDNRANFAALARAMSEMETAFEPPVQHYTAKGLYGRRAFAPAGSCVVTHVHAVEHFTVVLSGACFVVDQDGNRSEIVAPQVFVTQPGTQRALIAVTDVEWFTVHPHEGPMPEDPEAAFCCKTFEEYEARVVIPSPEDI